MTNPSLLRRIEALESVQSPSKPIILFKPYEGRFNEMAAFEERLAATKAAHPSRPIMLFSWGDPA